MCNRFEAAGASRWTRSILHGAGTMFAPTVLVGAGLYAAPAVTEVFGGARPITADVYRGLFGVYNAVLDVLGPFAATLLALTAAFAAFRVLAPGASPSLPEAGNCRGPRLRQARAAVPAPDE